MRSVVPMRVAKLGYIAMSVIMCIFGLILMLYPELSINLFGIYTGITLIVFGIIKIVGYLSRDLYRLAFQYDLAFGTLMIALGLLVMLRPGSVMDTICIAVGLAFLMDGLLKIQISIDARAFGIHQWWLIFAVAVTAIVIGVLLVFRAAQSARVLMILLGLSLLADGILNLITVIFTVKIIKNQYPDIIDGDFWEDQSL